MKNECIVGHMSLGKTGNFAKTFFYFLRADKYSICEVEITGKLLNLGDGEGMEVPCKLKLTGRRKFVNISQNSLTLSAPIPDKEKKFASNFYFHTSLWCLKRFYEGL